MNGIKKGKSDSMYLQQIMTLGQLKASGYQPKSIKQELRDNLVANLRAGKKSLEVS